MATWFLSNSDGSVVPFPTTLAFFFLVKKLSFGDNFKLIEELQGESELKSWGTIRPDLPAVV